jgi:hypothetical protein
MAKKQKLKLLMNIGKLDADQLGLDHSLEGESVTVDEKTAEILVKNGCWPPSLAEITSDLTAGTSGAKASTEDPNAAASKSKPSSHK